MQELNALEIGHVGGGNVITGQVNLDLPLTAQLSFTPEGLDFSAGVAGDPPLIVFHLPF